MKNLIGLCLLLSSMTCLANPPTKAKPNPEALDQMVAIVNDDVISRTELNHAIALTKPQLPEGQETASTNNSALLQKQVLDQLINKKIQLQIAKQAGIQTTDAELDKTISHIAKENNISVSELYDHIQQDGMSKTEYREEMRDQLTLHKIQQQEVANKVTISPEEITHFTRSRLWQTSNNKEYRLQDILIPLADAPSPADIAAAKKHADEILAEMKKGQTPHDKSLQNGDLGWRKPPEIPTAFAERVAHMKKSDVAGPIQTPNGFHVILLTDVRTDTTTQQKAPSRKAVEALLLQQKFEEAVQNWVSKLRSQAFIVTNL